MITECVRLATLPGTRYARDMSPETPGTPGLSEGQYEFSGDETTRDVATERVTPPAEDVAVHVDDEAPGATP